MNQTAAFYDPGVGEYVILDGNIIERAALYLVEKIKDYNPDIEVLCVDPNRVDSPFEEPFQICEWSQGKLLKIFGCWELNDTVLERLMIADTQRTDIEKLVDDTNEKVKKEKAKEAEEKAGVRKDLVAAIAANRTSKFTYKRESDDATITMYEDRPAKVVKP